MQMSLRAAHTAPSICLFVCWPACLFQSSSSNIIMFKPPFPLHSPYCLPLSLLLFTQISRKVSKILHSSTILFYKKYSMLNKIQFNFLKLHILTVFRWGPWILKSRKKLQRIQSDLKENKETDERKEARINYWRKEWIENRIRQENSKRRRKKNRCRKDARKWEIKVK